MSNSTFVVGRMNANKVLHSVCPDHEQKSDGVARLTTRVRFCDFALLKMVHNVLTNGAPIRNWDVSRVNNPDLTEVN